MPTHTEKEVRVLLNDSIGLTDVFLLFGVFGVFQQSEGVHPKG